MPVRKAYILPNFEIVNNITIPYKHTKQINRVDCELKRVSYRLDTALNISFIKSTSITIKELFLSDNFRDILLRNRPELSAQALAFYADRATGALNQMS